MAKSPKRRPERDAGPIEYRVHGRVTYAESHAPAAQVRVTAMDADLLFDDRLGEVVTDSEGRFDLPYGIGQFRDLFERAPDIYLLVRDAAGKLLTTTRDAVVRDAGRDLEILVQLPGPRPGEAGAGGAGRRRSRRPARLRVA